MNYISFVCTNLHNLDIIEIINYINIYENISILNIKKFEKNNNLKLIKNINFTNYVNNENIVNLKWKLREKYNLKFTDSNLQPSKNLPPGISHNHIIHITDSNEECIEVCKFILNKNPKEFENKKIGNIYIPWHIRLPKTFQKKTVKIDKIFVSLANDKNKYKISDTPHYKYLNNDKEAYLNYYKKYMGTYIQDNHIPQKFDKLINNFNPNTYNLDDSRLIIIFNNSVIDGCHRLAILQKNNITNINVFEINY